MPSYKQYYIEQIMFCQFP